MSNAKELRQCTQISAAVAAALEVPEWVSIVQAENFVVAYSFRPIESIRAVWEDAVSVAKIMDPDGKMANDGFSINLFTIEGLWEFPKVE